MRQLDKSMRLHFMLGGIHAGLQLRKLGGMLVLAVPFRCTFFP